MPDVKAPEEAVQALPPSALAKFRRWFTAFDSAAWDRQLEDDATSGKLDVLFAVADEDYASRLRRALRTIPRRPVLALLRRTTFRSSRAR